VEEHVCLGQDKVLIGITEHHKTIDGLVWLVIIAEILTMKEQSGAIQLIQGKDGSIANHYQPVEVIP